MSKGKQKIPILPILAIIAFVALVWLLLPIPPSVKHVGITGYSCTQMPFVSVTDDGERGVLKNNQSGGECNFDVSPLRYPSAYENSTDCPKEGCPVIVIGSQYEARNISSNCDSAINKYSFVIIDISDKVYGCYGIPGV